MCKKVTRLVPYLEPEEECMLVPREVRERQFYKKFARSSLRYSAPLEVLKGTHILRFSLGPMPVSQYLLQSCLYWSPERVKTAFC